MSEIKKVIQELKQFHESLLTLNPPVSSKLVDDFEDNRVGTSIFYDLGFKEVDRYQCKRFDKYLDIVVVRIDLNEENNNSIN